MKHSIVVLAMIGILLGACCFPEKRIEPSYPSKVSGWLTDKQRLKFYEERNFWSRGNFVLRKNEATDDGKIRLKVLDLIPPDPCAEGSAFQRQAGVKLQFIRMSDQRSLCEETFPENSASKVYSKCGDSLDEFGIDVVGVYSINIKEGWAFIRL